MKCPACIFDQNLSFSADKSGVTGRNSQENFTGAQKDLHMDSTSASALPYQNEAKHRDQTEKNEEKAAQRCLKLIQIEKMSRSAK